MAATKSVVLMGKDTKVALDDYAVENRLPRQVTYENIIRHLLKLDLKE